MSETAGNYTVRWTDAEAWEQLTTRRWSRNGEHFRWSLTWSLGRQWQLRSLRLDCDWWGLRFEACYQPDDPLRHEPAYDEAQGLRWADALVTLMTSILEAEAR